MIKAKTDFLTQTGHGGTDGSQNIEGYHETDPSLRQASQGTAEGTDWEGIRKANTPY